MIPVFSLQGGGIRYFLQKCAIASLEKQTGKLMRDVIKDAGGFIGGTSAGGLNVAEIVAGVPAEQGIATALKESHRIFSPTNRIERTGNLITKGRQFDVAVLHQVLQVQLVQYGDHNSYGWSLNDSPIPLLITGTDTAGRSMYFTQDRPTNSGKFGKYSLVDSAIASASATTYHDPWACGDLGKVADGGCSSLADPVYQTCVEAFKGYKCYGTIDPAEATVISLGTGWFSPKAPPDPPGPLFDRIKWVTSAEVGSSKTIAAETVERHYPGILQIFNPELPYDVDEADVNAIDMLMKLGQEAAAKIDWLRVLAGGK